MAEGRKRILCLFDVDGTLTPARLTASPEMQVGLFFCRVIFFCFFFLFFQDLLSRLRQQVYIGVVGGSDLPKQQEQLGKDVLQRFDYNFPENGIVAYHNGALFHSSSVVAHLGEERYKKLVNFILA